MGKVVGFRRRVFGLSFLLGATLPLNVNLTANILLVTATVGLLLGHRCAMAFSVVFNLFISVVPGLLGSPDYTLTFGNGATVSLILVIVNFFVSLFLDSLRGGLGQLGVGG